MQTSDPLARRRRLLELLSRAVAVSQPALQERRHALRDLLALTAHLPPRAVMVLWLSIGLGQKPREVARILRCRPGSVRKLTRRALERGLAGAAPPRAAVDPAHPIIPVPIVRPVRARRGQARRGSAPDRLGVQATPSLVFLLAHASISVPSTADGWRRPRRPLPTRYCADGKKPLHVRQHA